MADNSKQTVLTFNAGEFVIREKTMTDGIYIVKEGQLECFKQQNGAKIPLGIIGSGEYIGEMSLLMDRPHSSNVVALTDVKVIVISKEKIETQIDNSPGWLVALAKGLVTRLQNTNELLKKSGYVDDSIATKAKAIAYNGNKKAS